ncbi:MAG TPA: CehA/McbA family metallohydrolase [Cyclobacteriaceae bacterium]|nr:CehA/McbA family metallohydrolase [Cyclobacteriaceae bacterium]
MKKTLITLLAIMVASTTVAQNYKYYAGNLHAHTGYSDGNKDGSKTGVKTPEASFDFAKKSENFHYMGISEHNHKKAGMKYPNYAKGLQEAKASTITTFACLYGMEYGVIEEEGGHVLIYGVDDLIGWDENNFAVECARSDYNSLWNILQDYPDAFATLAHPEKTDYENLLNRPYNKNADKVICGVAIMTGPAFAKNSNYKTKSPKKFVGYYQGMLAAGYHVGPTVDHDNHYLTFGRMASSRTIVLATELNPESIMEAFREMRFYASTDWNVKVSFSVNGFPMGKRINTKTEANIAVSVDDPDTDDEVKSIKIMYGRPGSKELSTMLTSSKKGEFEFSHDLPKGKEYYYYLEIAQSDGDKVYTSPVWVKRLN